MHRRRNLKYQPLGRRSGSPELNCVKWVMVVLATSWVVLLCYVYYIGFQGMAESETTGGSIQNDSNAMLNGTEDNILVGLSDDLGKEVLQDQDDLDELNNLDGLDKLTNILEELNITDQELEVSDEIPLEEALSHEAGHVVTREDILNRIHQVVTNIRSGMGDKSSWQFILLLLQKTLETKDAETNKADNGPLQGINSAGIEESPMTLESPRVKELLRKLNTSLRSFDVYDFNQPLVWDFRCVFMKLDTHPEPAICIRNFQMDKPVGTPLAKSGTWEHLMFSFYIDIMKMDPHLQVVDLGSKLGEYSLAAAALGRPVLAVESSVKYIQPFHKSVIMNKFKGQIILVTNALSNTFKLAQLVYDHHGNMEDRRTCEITETMLDNDVIDPNDVIRTVTLNDLHNLVVYKKVVLKIDLQGDEADMFGAASHFFHSIRVRYVLMFWKYTENPAGYDVIAEFLKKRYFVPHSSPHSKTISNDDLKNNYPVIVWIYV